MSDDTELSTANVGFDGNNPINSDDGWSFVDPAAVAAAASGTGTDPGTGNRSGRRGRKPAANKAGGTQDTKEKVASLRGLDLKDILISIHAMLAIGLKTPALQLDVKEADKLEDAIKRIWRHYPLAVSQKLVDIAFAVTVCGEIYGTRIATIIMEKRASEKPSAQSGNGESVISFPFVR